jgi:hypothetical protein
MKITKRTVKPSEERLISRFRTESRGRFVYAGLAALCFVLMLLLPAKAGAQIGGTGTIEGTVTDQTGAVVAGARVVAKNAGTGAEMARTTNSDGRYSLAPLDVGNLYGDGLGAGI